MSFTRGRRASLVAAIAIAMGAMLMLATPLGIGLNPDSVVFAHAAREIAGRGDLTALPSHFPPLVSLALSVTSLLTGGDFALAGRVLQSVLFAANTVLIAFHLSRTGWASWVTLPMLILVVVQPSFLRVHLYLFSEPMFLTLVMLDIALLQRAIHRGMSVRNSIAIAAVTGLATMTRYAGLFLLPLNALALLMLSPQRPATRLRAIVVTGALGVLPFALWAALNVARGTSATNRAFALHPPSFEHYSAARATVSSWFHLPPEFGWIAIAAILLACLWAWRPASGDSAAPRSAARLWSLYVLTYTTFVLTSITVADFATPLNARIMVPLLPATAILALHIVREIRVPRIVFAATTVLALAFALNVRSAYWLLAESHAHGLGLASVRVKTSPILSAVRSLPSGHVVATNGPDLFTLYLPQKSIQFPYRYDPHANREAVDAEARMQALASRVDALCFFTEFEYRKYQPDRAQVAELARGAFKAFYEGDDGAVWVRESLRSAPD